MHSVRQRVDILLSETCGSGLTPEERYQFLPSVRDALTLTGRQSYILHNLEARIARDESRDCEHFDEEEGEYG